MKTQNTLLALVALTLVLAHEGRGQGSLTPPGAPGATMKTLDQVEPRTPISGGAVSTTISTPGSYYLTGNLTRTLTISTNNVTLDLMGYTIDPDSGNAIDIPADRKNLTIRNGTLIGAETGIDARNLRDSNSRFEKLTISDCFNRGLYIGSGCVVEDCLVNGCAFYGIVSSSAGKLDVRNCRITATGGTGLYATGGSHIVGNRIEDSGDYGLRLGGSGSYVANNIVKGNTDNYDFARGNQLNLLLGEIPETLDWPCSATFAGTLTTTQTAVDGITVAADDVTIDMAGHTLVGPGAASGHGICQADIYRNLRVFNGKISHWEAASKAGIYVIGKAISLTDVQVSTNYFGIITFEGATISDCTALGNASYGIYTISGSVLSGCVAYENRGYGIYAGNGNTVSGCVAYENSATGIQVVNGNTVSECVAYANGQIGIYASNGNTVSRCIVYDNGTDGLFAGNGNAITECIFRDNVGDGIRLGNNCHITHCTANGNGAGAGDGAGIHTTGDNNRIDSNNVIYNDRGIDVDYAGNLIIRNSASDNTLNWDVAAGNVCLVVQATTGGAISGNSGGTAPGSTDPNANFTY